MIKLKLFVLFVAIFFLKRYKDVKFAIKHNKKQFCSNKCSNDFRKQQTLFETTCAYCGKPIIRSKKDINKVGRLFCSRSCSAKTVQVGKKQTEETKQKQSLSLKKYNSENKHIVRKININRRKRIKKICPICSKEFFVVKCVSHRTYCSRMCCNNDKEHKYKKVGGGGYREGTSRGKAGIYKGYHCDSSWELAYVIYNLEHDIKFVRNKEGCEYQFNNKTHKYYPDFILEDGSYVEIKGYMTKQNKVKIESFKKPLKVLCKQEMQEYLKYVVDKYGKNFIELYESNYKQQNKKKNKCLICGQPAKNKYCSMICLGISNRKY